MTTTIETTMTISGQHFAALQAVVEAARKVLPRPSQGGLPLVEWDNVRALRVALAELDKVKKQPCTQH